MPCHDPDSVTFMFVGLRLIHSITISSASVSPELTRGMSSQFRVPDLRERCCENCPAYDLYSPDSHCDSHCDGDGHNPNWELYLKFFSLYNTKKIIAVFVFFFLFLLTLSWLRRVRRIHRRWLHSESARLYQLCRNLSGSLLKENSDSGIQSRLPLSAPPPS